MRRHPVTDDARTSASGRPARSARPAASAHPTASAHPAASARRAVPTGPRLRAEGGRPHPGRPRAARPGRLQLTRRGVVVLSAAGAVLLGLVVGLVVLVVRLVAGPADATTPVAPVAVPTCVAGPTITQNCWPAITEGDDPRLEVSPWVTGRLLAGDVRTVLDHVAQRFDAEVEPVDVDSSWGWAYRSVRGEDGAEGDLSNHASGTSIDLNATEHPLGAGGTFSEDQVAAIRAVLAEVAPVVAWGGDFDGRTDEMHFEIVGDPQAVAEVAARLRGDAAAG